MRKVFAGLVVAVLMFSAGSAFAAQGQNTIDGSLILGTAPASGFDAGIGLGVGVTIDMADRMKSSDAKLAIRGDMSYMTWDGDAFGWGLSYTRLMFFGGPRFYLGRGGKGTVMPYVEGGLELSFDEAEVATPFGKASASEVNLGLAGGGGVEIPLSGNLKLGVSGRLHLITDDFLSIAVTLGTSF